MDGTVIATADAVCGAVHDVASGAVPVSEDDIAMLPAVGTVAAVGDSIERGCLRSRDFPVPV